MHQHGGHDVRVVHPGEGAGGPGYCPVPASVLRAVGAN
jgi:hypothetical protein